jgi:hypothetical protein
MYSIVKASVLGCFSHALKNSVLKYNQQKHRTIEVRAINVTRHNENRLLFIAYTNVKMEGWAKFKVGNKVCVSNFKTAFDKVDTISKCSKS